MESTLSPKVHTRCNFVDTLIVSFNFPAGNFALDSALLPDAVGFRRWRKPCCLKLTAIRVAQRFPGSLRLRGLGAKQQMIILLFRFS